MTSFANTVSSCTDSIVKLGRTSMQQLRSSQPTQDCFSRGSSNKKIQSTTTLSVHATPAGPIRTSCDDNV